MMPGDDGPGCSSASPTRLRVNRRSLATPTQRPPRPGSRTATVGTACSCRHPDLRSSTRVPALVGASAAPSRRGRARSAVPDRRRRPPEHAVELEDAARLSRHMTASMVPSPSFSTVKPETQEEVVEEWRDTWNEEQFTHFVAERDGAVVGHALMYKRPATCASLGQHRPRGRVHRTGGAGNRRRAGIDRASSIGRDAGYPTMVTDWRMTNLWASRFWPSAASDQPSFACTGRSPDVNRVPLLVGTRVWLVNVPPHGVVLRPPRRAPPSRTWVRPSVTRCGSRSPASRSRRIARGGRATIVEPPALPIPGSLHDPRRGGDRGDGRRAAASACRSTDERSSSPPARSPARRA